MANRIQSNRLKAAEKQGYVCFYCRFPVWEPLREAIDEFAERVGLTLRQSAFLRCTAEHLIARQDGGKDSDENIAAACLTCNRRRHQRKRAPAAEGFVSFVQSRVKARKWHAVSFFAALAATRRSDAPT